MESLGSFSAYRDIAAAMLRTGLFGFGGGPSVMPLFRHEAVNRYRWVTDEEFAEILAFANALPGPIATKMAGYLGYRLKGIGGAVVAITVHIFPTCAAMIALMVVLNELKDNNVVSGMIRAVTPVVTAMLAAMAYEFLHKTKKGLGIVPGSLFCMAALLMLTVLNWNAGMVVALFLVYGAAHFPLVAAFRRRRKPDKEESS